ncbi:MAG: 2Fe-2S iron-sulfur cluster-binding protein [Verrucomicrobiota bacterium]
MVNLLQKISFILNDRLVSTSVPAGMLVLDFLRKEERLTGTKEGCKEGDCGACSVIFGELNEDGTVGYTPMTACLMPMGELEGKHVVTIEGLNMEKLSPVQNAMVDCGGSQCGYCTPGFVVSMTAGLMEPRVPLDKEGVLYAISGNLCRCTGYRSIIEAGVQAVDSLASRLNGPDRIKELCEAEALPSYFMTIPERLAELKPAVSDGSKIDTDPIYLGGGTDLYVQRGDEIPELPVDLLKKGEAPAPVYTEDGMLVLDARMSFEDFAMDRLVQESIPQVKDYNLLIASWPVRTRATLAGNICNASPIADMTCLLLALETELTISNAGRLRTLPLKDFFLGYKRLNKKPEEQVVRISFPVCKPQESVNWEKVSKRTWLDIATVNSAARIEVGEGVFLSAGFALGGVAATPLYLTEASSYLSGKTFEPSTVLEMIDVALEEFQPISDVRGSADYKRLLARQLLIAHFEKLFKDELKMEEIYAAL